MKTIDEWAGMTETDQWEEYVRVAKGDPTHDSPDTVVVRLQAEVVAAWESRNAWKLNAEASSKSCSRLRDERDAALTDNTRLRGLLREAVRNSQTPVLWKAKIEAALEGKP